MSALPVIAATSAASIFIAGTTITLMRNTLHRNIIDTARESYSSSYLLDTEINKAIKNTQIDTFFAMLLLTASTAAVACICFYTGTVFIRAFASMVSKYHYPIHHLTILNTSAKIASYIGLSSNILAIIGTIESFRRTETANEIIKRILHIKIA